LTVRGLQVVLARDLVQGLERVKIVLLHLLLSPPTHIRQREIVLSRVYTLQGKGYGECRGTLCSLHPYLFEGATF